MRYVTKDGKPSYEKLIDVDDKNRTSKINYSTRNITVLVPLFFLLTFLLVMPPQAYSVEPAISFRGGINDPEVYDPLSRPVIITVNDATVNDATVNAPYQKDIVLVQVRSSSDSQGISLALRETGDNTGVFKNTDLIFMDGNNLFSLDDTITVNLEGSAEILECPAIIWSTPTDEDGIFFFLSETSRDSGIFEGEFTFTSDHSDGTSLEAKLGDIISVFSHVILDSHP